MSFVARLLLFLFCAATPALAIANAIAAAPECPAIDANDAYARNSLMHYVCYYQASPGEPAHSARRPGELPESLEWSSARGHDLTFTQTRSVYWIRLNVRNSGNERRTWYLNLHYPLLDEVTFWWSRDPTDVLVTGDLHRFGSRAINYRYFLLPITLDSGESRSITLRVHSSGALNIPLKLESPEELITASNHLAMTHGLFYGAILVLAVFNLLLFISSGTAYYFHNALYMGAMGLFLLAMGGYANQYFWPESPQFANLSIPLMLVLCALAMSLFGRSFLEVEQGTRAYTTLKVIIWTCAGFTGLTLILPYSQTILYNTALSLIIIFVLSFIALNRWRQGYQPAKWYVLAWVIMAGGALIYAAAAFGYLTDFLARESLMQIAIGGQVILLNYAMVQRWRLLNNKLLEVEQQARTDLEDKVHERTAQLRSTMRELENANRKLAALSLNDPLTGLYNRRHMDNILTELCAESRRTGQPLTVTLLDADHFKSVNDTWGHGFGDLWLQQISSILCRHVKRPRDIAIRFGGEEFALLLPGTGTEGAQKVCEAILEELRATEIEAPDGKIAKLTLSAGIATLLPNESQQTLFARADRALYKAKSRGRDQVVLADIQCI
ncbi:diguanylate cyclase [Marinobacter sp. DY40_1A1]|uniref:sensor domain-containing diguanylate cyclase n=1 Tax=Marinobacter sp. DY40_1A1 TaxID=2583229 RepID=UPI001903D270|nr:diguanylate cyclase [Marinobacter sp. DY40_1A1]MBK1885801.1 GGDEF domain-containing protein [Marinobacter sp. DY40_1A1]